MGLAAIRDTVVLVDETGSAIGTSPKLAAHCEPGLLHLAISVFLYRPDGTVVLQRRADSKYHFPGEWANACCSHPVPGEDVGDAAVARVREELGIVVELEMAGSIIYRAPCTTSGLIEHEFDWVFFGTTDAVLQPDPDEVSEIAYVSIAQLTNGGFTGSLAPWFAPAFACAERARTALRRS